MTLTKSYNVNPNNILRMTIHLCRSLLFLFIAITCGELTAQDSIGLSTIPMLDGGEDIIRSRRDLNKTPQFKKIKEVYDNLVYARGDFRYPAPVLMLKDESGYVASIDYSDNTITMEKKAYEVCEEYGDIGFAYLLSHELTHFYEKHAWKRGFATDNADMKIGKDLKETQDGVAFETEADYLGGFLSYSAGYGLFDKGDEIISKLYSKYNLDDALTGYPIKSDRIELTKRSAKKLQSLVDLFEFANYSYAIGNFSEAYKYYQHILKQYQSRELYNNLGLIKVLQAIKDIGTKELKYKYPLELELRMGQSKGVSKKAKAFLSQAVRHFNAAINMDPNYAPAYLNKAIAYTIAGDLVRARFYLDQDARSITEANIERYPKTLTDLTILDGILLDKEGDSIQAVQVLSQLKDTGNDLARFNLDRVNDVPLPTEEPPIKKSLTKDVIDELNIEDYLDEAYSDGGSTIKLNDTTTFFRYTPHLGIEGQTINSKFYMNYLEEDDDLYQSFYITEDHYTGQTSSGIKIGSEESKVREMHGAPSSVIQTTQGKLLVYKTVIFVMDYTPKVTKWIIHKQVRD